MGTNYYLTWPARPGAIGMEEAHVGKQSAGWRFIFDRSWTLAKCRQDWEELISESLRQGARLKDEYGADIEPADFWRNVESHAGTERDPRAWHDDLADYLDREFS